ncbi:hypothetical protein ACQ4PT_029234 [Festuca glaucescens]
MAPLGDGVAPAAAAAPGLVVSFGEMLIDFVPDVAGVSLAESGGFVKAPGGAPANVACAVSKLGGSSAFVGKFGVDEFGHMLVEILKQNGVNAEECLFDQHARTALAFIRRARVFHYGSISLITEPCRSAHVAATRAAKAVGLLCSYDPNVRLPLWPSAQAARDGIMSIWKEADFIKLSDEEVAFLTQGDPNDEANVLSLWFEGLKLLVVTDGQRGCRYYTKDFKGSVPGYAVRTVDTTGAGHAFVGSLLVNVAKDDSIFYVRIHQFTYVKRRILEQLINFVYDGANDSVFFYGKGCRSFGGTSDRSLRLLRATHVPRADSDGWGSPCGLIAYLF